MSEDAAEPQPRKKSRSLKWVVIVLAGLCGVCCCVPTGLFVYVGYGDSITTDPDTIRARTAEIVTIVPPPHLQPRAALKPRQGRASIVIWGNGIGFRTGGMVLAESRGLTQNELDSEAFAQMEFQLATQLSSIDEQTTRTHAINGAEASFRVANGTAGGEKYVQLKGQFKGRNGPGFLLLRLPEVAYDEAEIDAMLKSME